jgi:hypothetical protein
LKIALVFRGDPNAVPLQYSRLDPIRDALIDLGVDPLLVAFSEETINDARRALLGCDGVLAWVDPLTDGVDRTRFDALLRDVAAQGVWVSAHPDVILKMGTKEVLVRTKSLGWGSDAYAYDSVEGFRAAFPARLAASGTRVLKQNRGCSNQGVWKVEIESPQELVGPDTIVKVLEARESASELRLPLGQFMSRCEIYLAGAGRLIDQPFQSRVGEGLVRCYMSGNKVVGFSEQFSRNRTRDASLPTFGMARDKTMHEETAPKFQALRRRMEDEWVPGLQSLMDIETDALPVLWDADFLYGPKTPEGEDTFVLCEINVSCVTPYPVTAARSIAAAAARLTGAGGVSGR